MRTIIALDLSHPICIHLAAVVNTSLWRPECLCAGSESRTSAERWMILFLRAAFLSPPVTPPGALCVCLSTRDRNNKVRPNQWMTLCFPSAPERQSGGKDQHWTALAQHHLMGKVHLESVLGYPDTYLKLFSFNQVPDINTLSCLISLPKLNVPFPLEVNWTRDHTMSAGE